MQPAFTNFKKTAERMLRTAGGPYAALVLLLIVCCVSNESFRSVQNLVNIMRQAFSLITSAPTLRKPWKNSGSDNIS